MLFANRSIFSRELAGGVVTFWYSRAESGFDSVVAF